MRGKARPSSDILGIIRITPADAGKRLEDFLGLGTVIRITPADAGKRFRMGYFK